MEIAPDRALSAATVNYDDTPITQVEVDGTDYRVDAGHGSAVAVSRREAGTWEWAPVTEGRWDGSRLRAKGLDHDVVVALDAAVAQAMSERAEGIS
jgi:hypothetical protein